MVAALSSCEDWLDDDGHDLAIGNFADGLDTPWEMVFAPDGRMFVTQRPGTISVIDKNRNETIWLQLDSVVAEVGESGLFGIELDPEFQQNHYVYFVFTCTQCGVYQVSAGERDQAQRASYVILQDFTAPDKSYATRCPSPPNL